MDSMVSSQPLSDERYSLRSQERAHKICILVSYREHLDSWDYVASAKGFGNESPSISTEFHDFVDQQLHRMNSASRTLVAFEASRQQNMIHATNTEHWVVHANGNT
jgi:hypothetical protein